MRSTLFNSTRENAPYSFVGQEVQYVNFRPQWTSEIARDCLAKLGIFYAEDKQAWRGQYASNKQPIIFCVGSGAGADASVFLEMNCIVYAIEPNQAFQKLAKSNLSEKS